MPTSETIWGDTRTLVPGWPYDRPAYESLAVAVQGEASRWNVPGIAAGVLRDGKVTTTAAGFGNLATRMPLVDDAILQIGSISKVWTATLAMMLVQDGLLDLDAPVVTYLEDLRLADTDVRETVTMRHLLSHTSGIEGDRFIDYGRGDDALAVAISHHDSLRQWFRPGDLWSYSNAGYYLACRVIEVLGGKPFETLFRERLIDPLGLTDTEFYAEGVISRPHAVGHTFASREAGHQVVQGYSLPRHVNGTGGVVTSTRQLLRFAELHMKQGKIDGTRLLRKTLVAEMQQPIKEAGDFHRNYGIGWCVHTYPDFRTISHGGATNGFRAHLTVFPDHDLAIATLSNGDAGLRAIQEIEAWALDHYLSLARPIPEPTSMGNAEIEEFAGGYTRHDSRMDVTAGDGHLTLTMTHLDEESGEEQGTNTYPLVPVGERRFKVPDGPGKDGIVDFIAYSGNGSNQELLRFSGRLAERTSSATKPAKKSRRRGKAKSSS